MDNEDFKNACQSHIRQSILQFTTSKKLKAFEHTQISELVERYVMEFSDGSNLRIVITMS